MAKQIVHVGLAVSTDGMLPSRSNIINLAAAIGDLASFNINVIPASGQYNQSPFWTKHPTEFEALKLNAEPLPEAMTKFRAWLAQWQGRLIACCSCMDFWHLFDAMVTTGGCPFGYIPIDTNSYYAGASGNKTPGRVGTSIVPLDVAKERWSMVSAGKMPNFGPARKIAKRKTIGNLWVEPAAHPTTAPPDVGQQYIVNTGRRERTIEYYTTQLQQLANQQNQEPR